MSSLCEDLLTICEMAIEENDESMLEELESGYQELEEGVAEQKLSTLLTGEYDKNNALVSFHAGAGGTEAQDWCEMLYRMYTRWAERHGYTYKIMDYQDGDEAGLKSADILIEGENAYGFLKGESGVHRLVRISPFDASGRRHTSFSAVEVIPDIPDDSADFEIKPEDYEMQVFRSSGAGGQHINKTSSAVRLIHKATGIVVPAKPNAASSRTRTTACACCVPSWSRSRNASIWKRFRTSRETRRRSNGAARSAPTSLCHTRSPRIRARALEKTPTLAP